MGSHQDRSQDQATPFAVESFTSTPPQILVDSTLPASQGPSATSSTRSRVSPTYMIPASSASQTGSQEAFPSSITLDEIPSLAQSSFFKSENESQAQHQFTLKVQQHPRIGLALGDERSSAKSSRVPPLDPPIICELIAETPAGASLFGILELALRATLVDGMSPDRVIGTTTAGLRPLHGDVDQSAFIAPIFTRTEQSLFIFSELGVRPTGDFRIRLDLVDRSGITFINLGCVYTERFTVVGDNSNHPGLSPSSDLMQAIVRRGLKLRLTKASKEEAPTSQSKPKKKTSASSTKRRVESPGSSQTEWASTSRAVPSASSSSLAQQYLSDRLQTAEAEALNRNDSLRTLRHSPADISGSNSPQDTSSRISPRPGIISRSSAPGRSSPLPPETTPHVLRATASLPRLPASSTRSDPVRPWEQPGSYLPPLRLAGSEEQYPTSRLSAQLPPFQSLPRPSSMRLPAMGPPALPSLYQPQQQHQQQHQPRYHNQLPQQPSYQQYHQPQQQYPQPQHQHQYQHQHQHQQQQRQSHDPYDQDVIMGPAPIPTASSTSSSGSGSGSGSQDDYSSNRMRLPSIQHVLNAAGDPGPRPSSRERHPLSAGTGVEDGGGGGGGPPSMEGSAEEGARRGHGGRPAGERWPWGQGYRQ